MLPKLFKLSASWRLWRDERGAIAVLAGLLLIPLIVATGLVIDGSLVFFQHRENRNAADAAALAATRVIWNTAQAALPSSYTAPDWHATCVGFPFGRSDVDAACSIATSSPFSHPTGDVRVDIMPTAGPLTNTPNHVQVTVTTQMQTLLVRLLGPQQVTVSVRAVGGATPTTAPYAIYALSETACEGLHFGGTTNLTVTGGGIKVNASCEPPSTSALEGTSGTTVFGGPIDVVGDADTGGGTFSSTPNEGTAVIIDPLVGLTEVVSAWSDADFDGTKDSATLSAANCTDSRCTASYSGTYKGYFLAEPVGVVAGTLRIPYYVSPINLANPDLFDACNAPSVGQSDGVKPTLFPGVYPGGIKMSNCSVYWERGVYVLAGRKNPGSLSLDVSPSSGNQVKAPDGVLIYITDDPFATSTERSAGGTRFVTSGTSSINMVAQDDARCPPRAGFQDILLFVDRDGPAGASDDTSLVGGYASGDCNNTSGSGCSNNVSIQGGGTLTRLTGTLYDPTGRFFATGSWTLVNSQLIFNVVSMQNSTGTVSCDPGGEGGPLTLPRLRE